MVYIVCSPPGWWQYLCRECGIWWDTVTFLHASDDLVQSTNWCHMFHLCVFKALLLHGSLPEDEQDVTLRLDQGNAEQQLVATVSPIFLILFSVLFFSLFLCHTLLRSVSPALCFQPRSHFFLLTPCPVCVHAYVCVRG